MKYDRNIFENNVSESFDFDFDFIKPIIENEWKYYIEIGFTSIDEVIAAYKELDLNVYDSVEYDYINADALPMINSILLKENVTKVALTERVNRKKVINYYMVSQYLVRHTYFEIEAKKVLVYLFFKKYPYFNAYPFLDMAGSNEDKKIKIYFGKTLDYALFFLNVGNYSYNIDLESFIKGDINKLMKVENNFSKFHIRNYTTEEISERTNNPLFQKVLEYAKSNNSNNNK